MEISSLSLKDKGRIYLDHNATTPPLKSVVEKLPDWVARWGNPSSIHQYGRGPKQLIREARAHIAKAINCSPQEIIFTSGGSESNNYVLRSIFALCKNTSRNEYITSTIEHPSVTKTFDDLENEGATVHRIAVNRNGEIDLDQYRSVLSERTALVSIMYANNETGGLMPIEEMVELAHAHGAKFHTDAVQVLGKMPVQLDKWQVDFATFASHKVYALKGVGLVYAKRGFNLKNLITGGSQERRRRAGTENTLAIAALGHVASLLPGFQQNLFLNMRNLRDEMERSILDRINGVMVTGAGVKRLPNTTSLLIDGIDGESLLMNLDIEGVAVSTGAACSSGSPEPSPVLISMGLSRMEAQKSLRISLGWDTTLEEINLFVEILERVVARLRSFHNEVIKHV